MSIFENEDEKPSDLEFNIARKNGSLFIIHRGWPYALSPPPIVSMSLSPAIIGIDKILLEGASAKGIDGGFKLSAADEWFFNCDVKAKYIEDMYEGWIYDIKGEGIKADQRVWVCSYLKLFFNSPPETMYLAIKA
jgi:hypothetical protein